MDTEACLTSVCAIHTPTTDNNSNNATQLSLQGQTAATSTSWLLLLLLLLLGNIDPFFKTFNLPRCDAISPSLLPLLTALSLCLHVLCPRLWIALVFVCLFACLLLCLYVACGCVFAANRTLRIRDVYWLGSNCAAPAKHVQGFMQSSSKYYTKLKLKITNYPTFTYYPKEILIEELQLFASRNLYSCFKFSCDFYQNLTRLC